MYNIASAVTCGTLAIVRSLPLPGCDAAFVLINALVGIIFAIFNKSYRNFRLHCITKCSLDLKFSVSLPQGTYGWSTVFESDILQSYSLFSKHSFFKHDKLIILAKRSQ